MAVYDINDSPTHDKLKTFCNIVRDAGFHWAWSDPCCTNQLDHVKGNDDPLFMFEWYRSAALVLVFLRGVCSPSQHGALVRSLWNTRVSTLREYIAAKAIRFYTEDWTPYLGLELPNHKESVEIMS